MIRATSIPAERAAGKLIGSTATVSEKPVLFSAPMIRAILSGQKTVTRRIVTALTGHLDDFDGYSPETFDVFWSRSNQSTGTNTAKNRYGVPGNRLWVRESFWQVRSYPMMLPSGEVESGNNYGSPVHYAADGPPANTPNRHYPNGLRGNGIAAPDPYADWAQRPSIHMTRKQSRITLEVTGVKVERLQDITEEQAKAEGVTPLSSLGADQPIAGEDRGRTHGTHPYTLALAVLWDTINGDKAPWKSNPFVWAIYFSRIKP